MLRLLALCAFTLGTTIGSAGAESPTKVRASRQWSGEKADPALLKAAPPSGAVTTQAEFDKLWAAWRGKEKVPTVDFKTDFVAVVLLTPGKGVRILKGTQGVAIIALEIDGKKNGTVMVGPALGTSVPGEPPPRWAATKGFYYGLAVFPRAGVRTFGGKDLPGP